MKTLRLSMIALLLLGALSCKKDTSSSASVTVTADQAADIASGALSQDSQGITSVTDDIAANAQLVSSVNPGKTVNSIGTASVHQECGTTLTDSATRSATTDSVTFGYFVKYTHTLNCNANNQPDNLINTLAFHGYFSGPRVMQTDTGSANVTIAGLTTASANFVLNGEYKRKGEFTSKVGDKASGNSNVDIVVTNLVLSKPNRKIVSGSATISVSGTTRKGVVFSYNGTLTFNGDGTAILAINGGSSYTINLTTGFKQKRV